MIRLVFVLLAILAALPALATPPTPATAPTPAPPPLAADALKPDEQGLAMRVQVLADGIVRNERWTAARATIVNVGPATSATLRMTETAGADGAVLRYERVVELPEGSRKDVLVPFRPERSFGERQIALDTDDGRRLVAKLKVDVLADSDVAIAVIGDDAMGVNAVSDTWGGPVPSRTVRLPASHRRVRVGLVPPSSLPDRSAPWSAVDWVVWPRPNPGELSAESVDALGAWVADGGHLLLTITDDWASVRASPLAELLPVELTGVADAPDLDGLLLATDLRAAGAVAAPVATATLREVPGRRTWVMATLSDGRPAWVIGTYGLGTVHVVLADPTLAPIVGPGNDRVHFWRRLLWLPPLASDASWFSRARDDGLYLQADWGTQGRTFSALDGWHGGGPLDARLAEALHLGTSTWSAAVVPERDVISSGAWDWQSEIRDKLNDIPGVAPLPLSWLLVFSVVYLLVIGPFDYFLLRVLGRQPLTWITFPVYIALFSAVALIGTSLQKGSQAAVVRVELVDALPGTDLWRGEAFSGVFSTRKTDLVLRGGFENSVVTPMSGERGAMWEPVVRSDEGAGRVGWRAETWTLGYLRSAWTAPAEGGLTVTPGEPGRLWVESSLPFDLEAAELCYQGQSYAIGRVPAGESVDFALTPQGYLYAPEIDLRTSSPDDLLRWAAEQLRDRPALDRGHLDPQWAHPSVLAIATRSVEPMMLTGLSPSTRQVTVLRIPVVMDAIDGRLVDAPLMTALATQSRYESGVTFNIVEIGPNDSYRHERHLIGKQCTTNGTIMRGSTGWYSGYVQCGDEFYYFQEFRLSVAPGTDAPPDTGVMP